MSANACSCADRNTALNLTKCKFCQKQVTFARLMLSAEGNQIDFSINNTISQFPNQQIILTYCTLILLPGQLTVSMYQLNFHVAVSTTISPKHIECKHIECFCLVIDS